MSKVKLPNKILPIKNKDKGFHEKWKEGREKQVEHTSTL